MGRATESVVGGGRRGSLPALLVVAGALLLVVIRRARLHSDVDSNDNSPDGDEEGEEDCLCRARLT